MHGELPLPDKSVCEKPHLKVCFEFKQWVQALLPIRGKAEGLRVLIHGGAGGVGSAAVQIAKAWGMHVTATCGTRNLDFVQQVCCNLVLRRGAWLHPSIHKMPSSRAHSIFELHALAD